MINRFPSTCRSVCLRLLHLQTAKMNVLPSTYNTHTILGEFLSASFQSQYQKRSYLVYLKANYGTSRQISLSSYEEVKDLPNQPQKLLIDVREPSEVKETGQIPCSINIPLGSVLKELSPDVTPDVFEKKYGHKKPHKNTELIFHCKIGKRSEDAAEIAIKLGYSKVKNYDGSWLDWAKREGLSK